MSDRYEAMLEKARRHICECEARIALQTSIIAMLEEGNHTEAAALARRVLETMLTSLDIRKQILLMIEAQSKR